MELSIIQEIMVIIMEIMIKVLFISHSSASILWEMIVQALVDACQVHKAYEQHDI